MAKYAINRRLGEGLVIDRNLTITVLKLSPSVVKLGVESASEHQIERSESPYWRYIPAPKKSGNKPEKE